MLQRTDGRKTSHENSEYIRMQAVKRVIKGKESPEAVIASFGLWPQNIYKWLKAHAQQGYAGLRSTVGGGTDPIVTDAECAKLKRWLIKDPRQLHFDFGLWTFRMIRDLIKTKFGKKVSLTTVGRVMQRIGYTQQRPIFRASQQNREQVKEYLEKTYPKIEREAKKERRIIFFGDEAGFRSDAHSGTTWSQKGKTPVVKMSGARYALNSISAVSKRGELRFMLYQGRFTSATFITFLRRLLRSTTNPVTLILDNHQVHKSVIVKAFVKATKGRLKLYYLPPYSPELNPDELVWSASKGSLKKKTIDGAQHFFAQIASTMHAIQKSPSLIQSFFRAPDLTYVTV